MVVAARHTVSGNEFNSDDKLIRNEENKIAGNILYCLSC